MTREKSAVMSEQVQTIKQLSAQNETLTQSFKDQLRAVQEDHQRAVALLQNQIDSLDKDNLHLQREMQQFAHRSATSPKEKSVTPTLSDNLTDFRHIERQEGEVSIAGLVCDVIFKTVSVMIQLPLYLTIWSMVLLHQQVPRMFHVLLFSKIFQN